MNKTNLIGIGIIILLCVWLFLIGALFQAWYQYPELTLMQMIRENPGHILAIFFIWQILEAYRRANHDSD
jgi:hypothetical protein